VPALAFEKNGKKGKGKRIMKKRQQMIGLALCLGLLTTAAIGTFSGCASSSNSRSTGQSTGQYMDDKTLQRQVTAALGDNPDYKFDQVNVDTYRGTVQLSGFVDTDEQKMKAEDIAKNVQGVTDVVNNITVRPAGQ
jgi:hyperosmotically inducible periplasmic protein